MSAAATRPTARVRASAAALKLALLFILLTPNRNHGSRTAAVDADDRPLGAQRYGTPSTRRHRSVGIIRRRARRGDPAAHRHPEARDAAAGRRRGTARHRPSGDLRQHLFLRGGAAARRHVDLARRDGGFEIAARFGERAQRERQRSHILGDRDLFRDVGRRFERHRAESANRSEEHTSELKSLMRISYAVFYLKKKNKPN